MREFRLYSFVNFYLNSISQGIQTAHAVHEMFMKYNPLYGGVSAEASRLYEWAKNHKTIIVLNGGMNSDIVSKKMFFETEGKKLTFPTPFAHFQEDEQSLGGVITCVAAVISNDIYEAVSYDKAAVLVTSDVERAKLGDNEPLSSGGSLMHYDTSAYFYVVDGVVLNRYRRDTAEWLLISMLKSCSLAR
jgi:hypothetical protein